MSRQILPPTFHSRYCLSANSLCAPQMMLAMCVRKPDDASTPTSFSQSGGSRRRLKSAKGSKSKTCKETDKREQEEKTEPEIVRDDEDGHLIYSKGDVLQSRCMPSIFDSITTGCVYLGNVHLASCEEKKIARGSLKY